MLAADVALTRGDFSLDVRIDAGAGDCVALVGPSGAGKSTLLRILAGLLRPERGQVALDGERWFDAASGRSLPVARRRVGFVFQDYALFPRMVAWRNVAYGIRGSRRERRAAATEMLERFGLGDRAEALPGDLSGGERQRVALARALAVAPRLLLLDEPLSALDAQTRAAAGRELAAVLAAAEAPAIVVTHDFAEAAQLAGSVAVLDGGRIVQRGTPAELAVGPGERPRRRPRRGRRVERDRGAGRGRADEGRARRRRDDLQHRRGGGRRRRRRLPLGDRDRPGGRAGPRRVRP